MPRNNGRMNDADFARSHGWTVGTRLSGKEYGATARVEITAIGRECVLGVDLDNEDSPEHSYTFTCRDWKPMQPEQAKPTPVRVDHVIHAEQAKEQG